MKFIIDKLEDVAENLRSFYKKRDDGKYQLDVDGAESAEDVAGLKSALEKERAENLEAKKKLEGLSKNELKELAKLKKAIEDDNRRKLEDDGNFEAVKAQMVAKHNEEIASEKSRNEKLMAKLRRLLVDNAATQAIIEAKGNPKLLLPIVKGALSLIEDGDDFSVAVIDEKGNTRISDSKGTPMSITAYVESLKAIPDFQPAFGPSGKSGGGAPPGDSGGGAPNAKPVSEWTNEEKLAFIQTNGMEAWRDKISGHTSSQAA